MWKIITVDEETTVLNPSGVTLTFTCVLSEHCFGCRYLFFNLFLTSEAQKRLSVVLTLRLFVSSQSDVTANYFQHFIPVFGWMKGTVSLAVWCIHGHEKNPEFSIKLTPKSRAPQKKKSCVVTRVAILFQGRPRLLFVQPVKSLLDL